MIILVYKKLLQSKKVSSISSKEMSSVAFRGRHNIPFFILWQILVCFRFIILIYFLFGLRKSFESRLLGGEESIFVCKYVNLA
jgi:hypothetical protein